MVGYGVSVYGAVCYMVHRYLHCWLAYQGVVFMNERIKKLAEQARQEFLKLPTGYTPEQVGMYPQLMEKFAELIVRECCDIFVELRTRPADLAVKDVKKHFGVEE